MNGIFNYNKWPWKVESTQFPPLYQGKKEWPKLSVIIPSFNQGSYIEETILSVIRQNYPRLELIIIDGGSKDETVEIIKKYEKHITYWVSEKDKGQSDAINKGMARATGDWIAWLNSDDCYLKNAFYYLFEEIDIEAYEFVFGNYLLGQTLDVNREVVVVEGSKLDFSKVIRFFYGIDYIIPSQSVFVRRELAHKVGFANELLHYCMDVEWYARILKLKPKVYKYAKTLCFYRVNETTKSGRLINVDFQENKMGQEAEEIALNYSGELNFIERIKFNWLYDYYLMYSKEPQKYEHCSLRYLLEIILRHPFTAISDRRILGLLKRKFIYLISNKFKY